VFCLPICISSVTGVNTSARSTTLQDHPHPCDACCSTGGDGEVPCKCSHWADGKRGGGNSFCGFESAIHIVVNKDGYTISEVGCVAIKCLNRKRRGRVLVDPDRRPTSEV